MIAIFNRIRYVNQYPLVLAGVFLILVSSVLLRLLEQKKPKIHWLCHLLFWSYIGGAFYFTVFARHINFEARSLRLTPFVAIQKAISFENGLHISSFDSLYQVFLNIMLFVPLGFMLPHILQNENLYQIVLLGFSLSLFIEVLQFVFGIGLAEMDDLIHNSFGTFVGCYLYIASKKLMQSYRIQDKSK